MGFPVHDKRRFDLWVLTVHFYPRAAAAGLRPILVRRFSASQEEWDRHPEWYTSHDVIFDKPPSKQDYLDVVAITPWMQGCKSLDVIKRCEGWPHVQNAHKAAHDAPLLDEAGVQVGHLDVCRDTAYYARGYQRQFLTVAAQRLALRGIPADKRTACDRLFSTHANIVANRLAVEHHTASEREIAMEWKRLFREMGIIRGKKLVKSR